MKFNKTALLALCFLNFGYLPIFAQIMRIENGIRFQANHQQIEIIFNTQNIVKIVKSPIQSAKIAGDSDGNLKLMKKESVDLQFSISDNLYHLKSGGLNIEVDLTTGMVSFFDRKNKHLIAEQESAFFENADFPKNKYRIQQSFSADTRDPIYGLGQHQAGLLNQRMATVRLKQKNMEIAIPFFQSKRGYGLYWDNYSITDYNGDERGIHLNSEYADRIVYYIIQGDSSDDVISRYRQLTGRAPLLPLWSLGYLQSRERYSSQEELYSVVKRYRELQVPLDAVVQDWRYWGASNGNWNSTSFDNPKYSFAEQYIDSIHQLGAKVIISVWPSFGSKTEIFKELNQSGALYDFLTFPISDSVKVYDAFNDRGRDILWKYMYRNLYRKGIDGWWLDAAEPVQKVKASRNVNNMLEEETRDAKNSILGITTAIGDFAHINNLYPLYVSKGIYDNQRKQEKDKRIFILTRSAFAGQQQYGTVLWSGDIEASWQVLRDQIPAGLNLSMSGFPYWNTDIGGFYTYKKYPKGVKDPAYQELYVRWLQFATFNSLMRSHGTNTPREIYQFGKKGDWAYDSIEKFIRLRYRLVPYLYSVNWQVYKNHATVFRPLVMDFSNDKQVEDLKTQFMFGPSFLVSPVLESMKGDSLIVHKTYLPENHGWYDFWNNTYFQGGTTVTRPTGIKEIPIYIKAGSIIPWGKDVQYLRHSDLDVDTLRIYGGVDGRFQLFQDTGEGYGYERGEYQLVDLQWNERERQFSVSFSQNPKKNKSFIVELISWDKVISRKEIVIKGKYNKLKF